MSRSGLAASLLGLEQRLRTCTDHKSAAYTLVSGLAELLRLQDAYIALPGKSGRLKVAGSLNHPVANHASVSVQWVQRQVETAVPQFEQFETSSLNGEEDLLSRFPSQMFLLRCEHPQWPVPTGAIIGFRDTPWTEAEIQICHHLVDVWSQNYLAIRGLQRAPWKRFTKFGRRKMLGVLALTTLPLLVVETPQSIVAPLEVESRRTSVVAPLFAGVLDSIDVSLNQSVRAGEVLATIESEPLRQERLVQALELQQLLAERTSLQTQNLNDPAISVRFVTIEREIELMRARLGYIDYQLEETVIRARRDGVIQFDSETEVERRPVEAGQSLMRIVAPDDLRAKVYLPANNLISIDPTRAITATLDKTLLQSFEWSFEQIRPQPVVHPTLGLVYELYATIPDDQTGVSVGLGDLGKARVYGPPATLIVQIVRRPWLALRGLFL